jgi:hypothetical protein
LFGRLSLFLGRLWEQVGGGSQGSRESSLSEPEFSELFVLIFADLLFVCLFSVLFVLCLFFFLFVC